MSVKNTHPFSERWKKFFHLEERIVLSGNEIKDYLSHMKECTEGRWSQTSTNANSPSSTNSFPSSEEFTLQVQKVQDNLLYIPTDEDEITIPVHESEGKIVHLDNLEHIEELSKSLKKINDSYRQLSESFKEQNEKSIQLEASFFEMVHQSKIDLSAEAEVTEHLSEEISHPLIKDMLFRSSKSEASDEEREEFSDEEALDLSASKLADFNRRKNVAIKAYREECAQLEKIESAKEVSLLAEFEKEEYVSSFSDKQRDQIRYLKTQKSSLLEKINQFDNSEEYLSSEEKEWLANQKEHVAQIHIDPERIREYAQELDQCEKRIETLKKSIEKARKCSIYLGQSLKEPDLLADSERKENESLPDREQRQIEMLEEERTALLEKLNEFDALKEYLRSNRKEQIADIRERILAIQFDVERAQKQADELYQNEKDIKILKSCIREEIYEDWHIEENKNVESLVYQQSQKSFDQKNDPFDSSEVSLKARPSGRTREELLEGALAKYEREPLESDSDASQVIPFLEGNLSSYKSQNGIEASSLNSSQDKGHRRSSAISQNGPVSEKSLLYREEEVSFKNFEQPNSLPSSLNNSFKKTRDCYPSFGHEISLKTLYEVPFEEGSPRGDLYKSDADESNQSFLEGDSCRVDPEFGTDISQIEIYVNHSEYSEEDGELEEAIEPKSFSHIISFSEEAVETSKYLGMEQRLLLSDSSFSQNLSPIPELSAEHSSVPPLPGEKSSFHGQCSSKEFSFKEDSVKSDLKEEGVKSNEVSFRLGNSFEGEKGESDSKEGVEDRQRSNIKNKNPFYITFSPKTPKETPRYPGTFSFPNEENNDPHFISECPNEEPAALGKESFIEEGRSHFLFTENRELKRELTSVFQRETSEEMGSLENASADAKHQASEQLQGKRKSLQLFRKRYLEMEEEVVEEAPSIPKIPLLKGHWAIQKKPNPALKRGDMELLQSGEREKIMVK